jgi:hypothetical protein
LSTLFSELNLTSISEKIISGNIGIFPVFYFILQIYFEEATKAVVPFFSSFILSEDTYFILKITFKMDFEILKKIPTLPDGNSKLN